MKRLEPICGLFGSPSFSDSIATQTQSPIWQGQHDQAEHLINRLALVRELLGVDGVVEAQRLVAVLDVLVLIEVVQAVAVGRAGAQEPSYALERRNRPGRFAVVLRCHPRASWAQPRKEGS